MRNKIANNHVAGSNFSGLLHEQSGFQRLLNERRKPSVSAILKPFWTGEKNPQRFTTAHAPLKIHETSHIFVNESGG